MTHQSVISLPYIAPTNAPRGEDNADQYPESFPRYFLEKYSRKGDYVFDPFLGFGTTAFIAEELERTPFGIEADSYRFEWAAGQLENWQNMRLDDAYKAAKLGLPQMDMLLTSPPFMQSADEWNPLYSGDPAYNGYAAYLERLENIFANIKPLMKAGAPTIIHSENINGNPPTPLKADMRTALEKAGYTLKTDITIKWENGPEDWLETGALIFKA